MKTVYMKPLGKISHLDLSDPWNRLRGNSTIIMRRPVRKETNYTKKTLKMLNTINSLLYFCGGR